MTGINKGEYFERIFERSRTEPHRQSQENSYTSNKSWRTLECNFHIPISVSYFLEMFSVRGIVGFRSIEYIADSSSGRHCMHNRLLRCIAVVVRVVNVTSKLCVLFQAIYGRGRGAKWEKAVYIIVWIMARKVAH